MGWERDGNAAGSERGLASSNLIPIAKADEIVQSSCLHCGFCYETCPHGAIEKE